ncbi:MAG TPA: type I-F CRISPR-associated endoribonuclease Cas6/Csy4 [Pseudomonas sp.]|nr:type I-F CRISPR-associated endoribonuclease Cas6/Csy4 [Pseudomonas sp.]MBB51852.1 type I-F CRISPR-associated endoribonuclease Cas6/Csy4 [Pseudomonadales bacterium]MBB52343.1 type I-F CRISPR-associated endoribonuclease Cas6/Csy4 [Pseudomonadales bacterium]HCA24270.1 type I-F CRISPR-associated endoribonuclease Cas6/Csy4 [Pseudomonas sp.]|tara:strand:- start:13568 stop:14125 length:558 start_codon:yes stop_codon:yes gene_type:complete
MDHYLDIRLLPDPEFPAPILMNALFAKLHRALVAQSTTDIGISFPGATPSHLGGVMRLHGSAARLDTHMAQQWLQGMRDHLDIGAISPVPDAAGHCQVRRVQSKSSAERLRRRYLKRHPEVDEETAAQQIPNEAERRLALPYLRIKSSSSDQQFLLFIQQRPEVHQQTGDFNSYGLSSTATIPWF